MKPTYILDEALAKRVIAVVSKGLSCGLGTPVPGSMCVEAAVCYAMNLPHGDEPTCVHADVRKFKIHLNDSSWSSNKARAEGMLRIAIAQLGSESIDIQIFKQELQRLTIKRIVATALREAAKLHPEQKHKDALEQAAKDCEANPSKETARAVPYSARS